MDLTVAIISRIINTLQTIHVFMSTQGLTVRVATGNHFDDLATNYWPLVANHFVTYRKYWDSEEQKGATQSLQLYVTGESDV